LLLGRLAERSTGIRFDELLLEIMTIQGNDVGKSHISGSVLILTKED
jgi:hypothetical protein